MNLADKQALFEAGTPEALEAVSITVAEAASRGLTLGQHRKGLLLEPQAALHAPVAGMAPCFIGAHSYMNEGGYIRGDDRGVFIGRYCSIGRRVSLGAGRHRIAGLSSSPALRGVKTRGYTREEAAQVRPSQPARALVVGSDVLIGDGAVIMPGVHIGVGAVIAANAVVTEDVAPYAIVGGLPARPIGLRFPAEVVERLLATRWWEADAAWLNTLPLSNVHAFLEALSAGGGVSAHTQPTYVLTKA